MPVMAKKKPQQPINDPAPKPPVIQHPLRFDSRTLLDALDKYSNDKRQSRNAAILTILEQILRREGYLGDQKESE